MLTCTSLAVTAVANSGFSDNDIHRTRLKSGGGRLDDFHCFDLDNTRWSCVEPSSGASPDTIAEETRCLAGLTPGMRENNGLIEFRGKLYLFGGYNGQQWLNDLFSFDLFTKEWHNVDQSGITQGLRVNHILLNSGQPPASRFGYVSVVHNNFFVVFGGYDGSTWLNDMHQYDFETWTWCAVQATGQIPSIRSCPSWCKEGDSVFVFGGYDGVQRMNDLFECNLETHTRHTCWAHAEHSTGPYLTGGAN
mmetsp:Transcript_26352/g.85315  ORF Transcript_26352/g.85315 Transcript_26352/m.85315 type:complete len:249 (-) Transcript_26352:1284-2030(-)